MNRLRNFLKGAATVLTLFPVRKRRRSAVASAIYVLAAGRALRTASPAEAAAIWKDARDRIGTRYPELFDAANRRYQDNLNDSQCGKLPEGLFEREIV